MTRQRIKAAWIAIQLAIEAKILGSSETIECLAGDYGKRITTQADLDVVWSVIDKDRLTNLLQSVGERT